MIKPYEIRRIAIDSSSWTGITPPMDCNGIGIETDAGGAFKVATDPNDALQFFTVPDGMHRHIGLNPGHGEAAFKSANVVIWLRMVAGSDTAVLEFYR